MAASKASTWGVRAYGIGFLALLVLFVYLTYAIFTKKFTDYDKVTLESSKIGLSLPSRADVKIRGVIVGEVLDARTSGDGAELTLGLNPDKVDTIPANVSAQILPKTLFGEKYVSLEIPNDPAPQSIKAGDVIAQSKVAIELEAVLNDLFPLLRTVQPAQLNYTLTAVANALEGRGDAIGANLETLDGYLKRLNPQVPDLVDSLIKLGSVSQTYEAVVPDLVRLLRNSVTTTDTFETREDQIKALFDDVASFSGTAGEFLRVNGDNMITLADQGRRILPILARYSPEYRCFLRGIVESIPRNEEAFRDKTLHIILETIPKQPRGYNAGDQPSNSDNRGSFPLCGLMYDAIAGKYGQSNLPPDSVVPQISDGVNYPLGKRAGVGSAVAGASKAKRASDALPELGGGTVMGTAAEQQTIGLAAAAVLGVPVDEVPGVTTLLLGPVARGMELDVR